MTRIKLAAAVLNQTPLDWDGNFKRICGSLEESRRQQATVVCLPELCITGYGCEDAFLSRDVQQTAWEILHELLPHTSDLIVSLGLPILHGGGVFNCAAFVADGKLLGLVGKQNLAGDGIHYEPRWFKPWPEGISSTLSMAGTETPIGDLVFDCGGVRFGFEICEDAWVGHRPGGGSGRA